MPLNDTKNSKALYAGPHIFFRPVPAYVDAVSLSIGVAKSYTVPQGYSYIIFSATDDFYVNSTTTATIPGDTTNGSASELNPVGYTVEGGETLSLISSAANVITISAYPKE